MKMNLRWSFLNGHFGDPSLYIWEINTRHAILIDCGDLSKFSTRQLLKVTHIFLSHCHIDHFFGFDQFLRVHVGSEKIVTIMGPSQTSERVAGKLKGYTWNLIWDKNLEFVVIDFDSDKQQKKTTRFHAKNAFQAEYGPVENWTFIEPIFDSGNFKVTAITLDHRTPSMAYTVEEKISFAINKSKLDELGFIAGPWLNELKQAYLSGLLGQLIQVELKNEPPTIYSTADLAQLLLLTRPSYKIAYVTDGAAHKKNFELLFPLIKNADILIAETCFIEQDRILADETKHFTALFIARLAAEAEIKKIMPFHFSKRYLTRSDEVFSELQKNFTGEIIKLPSDKKLSI